MNLSWLSGHEVSQAAAFTVHLSGSAQRMLGVGVKLVSTAWVQNWGSWRALGAGGRSPGLVAGLSPPALEADSKALDAAGDWERH